MAGPNGIIWPELSITHSWSSKFKFWEFWDFWYFWDFMTSNKIFYLVFLEIKFHKA